MAARTMRLIQAAGVATAIFLAYSLWKVESVRQNEVKLNDPERSLCFSEASLALLRAEITETEYYFHLFAHLQGVRHSDDDLENIAAGRRIQRTDSFGSSIRAIALKGDYEPLHDINIYQKLAESSAAGNIATMRQILDKITIRRHTLNIIQPLAVLAARSGQPDMLNFCLFRGATFDKDLDQALFSGLQTTATLEILWSHNWHDIRNSVEVQNRLARDSIYQEELLMWLIDHGAVVDLEKYKRAAFGPVSVPVMKILAKQFGPEPLQYSGSLQMAALRGDTELVEYLLEIGLDPNEIPPQIDIREPLYTALYEAVTKQNYDTARLLVMHGANVDHPHRTRSVILAMATEHNDDDLVEFIHKIKIPEGLLVEHSESIWAVSVPDLPLKCR